MEKLDKILTSDKVANGIAKDLNQFDILIRKRIKARLAEMGKSIYWLGKQAQAKNICSPSMVAKFLNGQEMSFTRVVRLAILVGVITTEGVKND